GDPIINNDNIIIRLKDTLDSYEFAPVFTLSEGATISPENGTSQDFSTPQKYTVTSADKAATKTYTIKFVVDNNTDYSYSFENVEIVTPTPSAKPYNQYYYFVEGDQ